MSCVIDGRGWYLTRNGTMIYVWKHELDKNQGNGWGKAYGVSKEADFMWDLPSCHCRSVSISVEHEAMDIVRKMELQDFGPHRTIADLVAVNKAPKRPVYRPTAEDKQWRKEMDRQLMEEVFKIMVEQGHYVPKGESER